MKNKNDLISKLFWSVISVLLAVLTIKAVMAQSKSLSVKELFDFVAASNQFLVALGILFAGFYVWFEGTALRVILKRAGYNKKRMEGLLYSTSDVYFSAITPSATGGQPASAYFMIKDGVPGGVAAAALVLNLMMYNVSVGALGIIAVLVYPGVLKGFNESAVVFIVIGISAVTLTSVFFFFVLKKGDRFFALAGRLLSFLSRHKIVRHNEKWQEKLKRAGESYAECSDFISGKTDLLVKTFIWNFLQRASQILVPVFLYLSAGGEKENAVRIFSKQCLITIGYNYIPVPGAMGVSDFLMLDGFKDLMGRDMAFRLEMVSRGVSFYLCVLVCGLITLAGYMARKRRK
ncbi:MAG: flippase-like domain-containing protein [Lachnospiraceae bacterium]|nr:flippase-like domain-containing protein [Lachnospiraceae bacterium]